MIFMDVHVHMYSCFNVQTFFDSAYHNFLYQGEKLGLEKNINAVIFITDWAGENWYQTFYQFTEKEKHKFSPPEGWQFSKTNERSAFMAFKDDRLNLYIIAGRKIVTAENLEALSLCTEHDSIPDNLSIEKTIEEIQKVHGVPVIPWAVGKWLGHRGIIIEKLIKKFGQKDLLLCDNGNRPSFWSWPSHFSLAQSKQIKVLSGSDPLHFSSEAQRVGSFGSWMDTDIDTKYPSKDLKKQLLSPDSSPNHYGSLESLLRFFYHQTLMQILKKKWKTKIESLK